MPITETLALALPFVVTLVGALAGARLSRSPTFLDRAGGALVVVGAAATLALLVGAPHFPPSNAAEWTWVALALSPLALLPGVAGALGVGVVVGATVLALARPLLSGDDASLALGGALLLALGSSVLLAPRQSTETERAHAGGIAVAFLGLGLALALSGSLRYAFLAFGAGLAVGGLTLASLFVAGRLGKLPLAAGASLYGVIASMGALYVETPVVTKGALLVAPLVLALATPVVARALRTRARLVVLSGALAVLIPVVAALVPAALAYEPDPYAAYR